MESTEVMNESTKEGMTDFTERTGAAVQPETAGGPASTVRPETDDGEEPSDMEDIQEGSESSGEGPVIRAKYNKQELTFTAEEAVPLVQMGLKFRALEPSYRRLRQLAAAEGLGLPALIDRLAKEGRDDAYTLPHPFVGENPYDMSFSGLKTAVINLAHHCEQTGEALDRAGLAASLCRAVSESLVPRTMAAAAELGYKKIAVAGGVARIMRALFAKPA